MRVMPGPIGQLSCIPPSTRKQRANPPSTFYPEHITQAKKQTIHYHEALKDKFCPQEQLRALLNARRAYFPSLRASLCKLPSDADKQETYRDYARFAWTVALLLPQLLPHLVLQPLLRYR